MCTDDVRECVCLLLQLCVRVRVCVTATLVSLKSELVVGTINRRRVMQAAEKKNPAWGQNSDKFSFHIFLLDTSLSLTGSSGSSGSSGSIVATC